MKNIFFVISAFICLLSVVIYGCKKNIKETVSEKESPIEVSARVGSNDEIEVVATSIELSDYIAKYNSEIDLINSDTSLISFMQTEAFSDNLVEHQPNYEELTENQQTLIENYLEIYNAAVTLETTYSFIASFDEEDWILVFDTYYGGGEISTEATCHDTYNTSTNRCFRDFLTREAGCFLAGGFLSPTAGVLCHFNSVMVQRNCNKDAYSDYQHCLHP
jgi:hypothetical protein